MWYIIYDLAICSKKGAATDGGRKEDRDGTEGIEQISPLGVLSQNMVDGGSGGGIVLQWERGSGSKIKFVSNIVALIFTIKISHQFLD